MALESDIRAIRNIVDKALDRCLPAGREEPKVLHKAMRYSVFSGGKRIRPVIAIEACRACGGSIKGVMPAACAVELVHAYSLIHDDLPSMDDDDFRRGKPACHKAFGEADAILAGDALLTLAFNILSKLPDARIGLAMVRELSDAIGSGGMVGGQAADLIYKDRQKNARVLSYINRLKTARLFEASAKLGAIAARAGDKKIKAMAAYGLSLGLAFQITDDIIDKERGMNGLDINRARCASQRCVKRAKGALEMFGSNATRLRAIAGHILHRVK